MKVLKFLKENQKEHFVEDYWRNETRKILGSHPYLHSKALSILDIFNKQQLK